MMRRSPPWRIRGIFLPCLVAALLFGGCGATTGSPAAKQILRQVPREERIALVVLNFRNATLKEKAAEYEPWGFGIPSMIMTDLESIGLSSADLNLIRFGNAVTIFSAGVFGAGD